MKTFFLSGISRLSILFILALGLVSTASLQTSAEETMREYQTVDMKTLSRLYWKLKMNKIEDDGHIDNYMLINDCDVYRDYYHNEFQWKKVRAVARQTLEREIKTFDPRLQIVQPLRFADYSAEKEGFELWGDYDVDGLRRLEVMAEDSEETICGISFWKKLYGYPRGIAVEFSKPLSLDVVPVRKDKAERYIEEKSAHYSKLPYYKQTEQALYDARDAYLVLRLRGFSYRGTTKTNAADAINLARILVVLESLEVYADKELTDLLYKREFREGRKSSPQEEEMKKKYQERLKRHQEKLKAKEAKKQQEAAES